MVVDLPILVSHDFNCQRRTTLCIPSDSIVLYNNARMATIDFTELKRLSELHLKPAHIRFQYGTAGFRTLYVKTPQLF